MRTRAALALTLIGLSACSVVVRPSFPQRPQPLPAHASCIAKAIQWLEQAQVTPDEEARCGVDVAGSWPQWFRARDVPGAPSIRDASPYVATFVHQALANVRADTVAPLGLAPEDLLRAQRVRHRAIGAMRRFARPGPQPGTTVYGFWPARCRCRSPLQQAAGSLVLGMVGGPRLYGDLAPQNVLVYPSALQIWPDLDTTSLILTALHEANRLDGAPAPSSDTGALFAAARDLGPRPLRFPAWLAPGSGAYVTWFSPACERPVIQDVDLGVNANVLLALGRSGDLDAPGARAATDLLVRATQEGRHRRIQAVSDYYLEGFVYHYLVARAYADGPVPGLAPAVDRLACEVEAAARTGPDGRGATWPGPSRPAAIACAVLTLLHAGRRPDLVAAGLHTLETLQDPDHGDWGETPFCRGEPETGLRIIWTSRAFGVALALEALCRARAAGIAPCRG